MIHNANDKRQQALPSATVWCRRPGQQPFALTQYAPVKTFTTLDQLPETGGFVIAPFEPTAACPILFIEADKVEEGEQAITQWQVRREALHRALGPLGWGTDDSEAQRVAYARAFRSAHSRLARGEVNKVVLSRRLHWPLSFTHPVTGQAERDAVAELIGKELFVKACAAYPECFITLWHIPGYGTWVTATPEPILRYDGAGQWSTVALAGTQPVEAKDWSAKNREEQAIVARFVADALSETATGVSESPTYAFATGRIQHLRTDFRFSLPDEGASRRLLRQLHPTPAVCGMPRDAARSAILADETAPRRYYAGFSGPYHLHLSDEAEALTALYVTLRCAEVTADGLTLYAGGGLMPESNEADEWAETCRKIDTLRRLVTAPADGQR